MPIPETRAVEPLSLLEISLDSISRNYLALQKRLTRGTDCAAVVKADAYGLGAAVVSVELYKSNCRHFYAAHAAEGVVVRRVLAGLEDVQPAQVYALHGMGGIPAEELLRNNIVPVLNSYGDIEQWSALARKVDKNLPAVLHIDTGMNRLGLSADEVVRLKNNTDLLKGIDVRYVMSHLACSDTEEHPKNQEQLEAFKKLTAQLGLPCRLSFANSGGIFLGSDYHFDQARPGCALYGINPQTSHVNPMQGVVTLKARILQIRNATAGETVGYGAGYKLSAPMKLATISAGYADGILRSIAENGMVYISGQKCPLVGRVSMDLVVADVTAVQPEVHVGDWVEIIGSHQTADDVAAQADTIGYEVLTSLGKRYKRVYT